MEKSPNLSAIVTAVIRTLCVLTLLIGALVSNANAATRPVPWPSLFTESQLLDLQTQPSLVVVPRDRHTSAGTLLADTNLRWQSFSNQGLPTNKEVDVWIRLVLSAEADNLWVLRFPEQTLESITVFSQVVGGATSQWTSQSAGLMHARSQWPLRSLDPAFMLQTSPQQARQFLLRIQHRSPLAERLQLVAAADFSFGASRMGALNGLLIGLFSTLIVISAVSWWLYKSDQFAWFGLFVLSVLLTQLTLTGFLSSRVWVHAVNWQRLSLWIMPLLSLAACIKYCLSISYAKDVSRLIFVGFTALIYLSLALALSVFVMGLRFPMDGLIFYFAAAATMMMLGMGWLAWRVQPWLWIIVAAILPLCLSVFARLSYNLDWVSHAEVGQLLGALSACASLLTIYAAMLMHSRDQMARTLREQSLDRIDVATGLLSERIAMARLPQMLLRAERFEQPCAIIMLRWLDFAHINSSEFNANERSKIIAHLGSRISRVTRDIDSCARVGDDLFLYLVEAPAGDELINEITSRLLTSCLRPSANMPGDKGFDLHMAVWQSHRLQADVPTVLELLKTRLNQMTQGTQRRVQLVDTAMTTTPSNYALDQARPKPEELLAKINSLEKTQGLPSIAVPPRKSVRASVDTGSK